MASVFISYRRNDSPGHAGRLFDALRASFGNEEVFMDVAGIPGGEEYAQVIEKAIRTAKVMLAVVGPEWNHEKRLSSKQDWIRQEIALAFRHKVHLLPIRVDGAPIPKDDEVPQPLRRLFQRHALELRDERWDSDIEQVTHSIKLLLSPELAAQGLRQRQPLRILVCHDLAAADADGAWERRCRKLVSDSVNRWSALPMPVKMNVVSCAEVFEEQLRTISPHELYDLTSDLLSRQNRPKASNFDGDAWAATTPSDREIRVLRLVSCWLRDDRLRRQARVDLQKELRRFAPTLVLAYGAGALVAYDALSIRSNRVTMVKLVTLGSPLASWPVRSVFGGRITIPRASEFWLDLANPQDGPFGQPLSVAASNFAQLEVPFGPSISAAQSFEGYLNHATTRNRLWPLVVPPIRKSKRVSQAFGDIFFRPPVPARRALLVGISDYPDPEDRLRGCVNDVFLMSSVLQEAGFEANDIVVLTNERAPAVHVRQKLHWLLDGVDDGQERLFYFSGHGAVLPFVRPAATVRGAAECLATYDFDWSIEHCIHDEFLMDLYAQLSYGVSFKIILDCGFPPVGGHISTRGTRGLNPPDDIQHALQRWNAEHQMWTAATGAQRLGAVDIPADIPGTSRGRNGARPWQQLFAKRAAEYGHLGHYSPVIMTACRPDELCLEFRHGTNWFGAFTYALSHSLRDFSKRGRHMSYHQMTESVARRLKMLRCSQTPRLFGPRAVIERVIPRAW